MADDFKPPQVPEIRAMVRRLHRDMDTDAAIDALIRGYTRSRALPEMELYQLKTQLPPRTAELLHLIPSISRAMLRGRHPAHPIINGLQSACGFMHGLFLGLQYEHCYLLTMRKNRRLINANMIQRGTVDQLPFYPRNIMQTAIADSADALVIAHNHPGGICEPSQEDVNSTVMLIEAMQPLGIPLLDHLIFANDRVISIRENDLIPEDVWLSQPNNCQKFLDTWLTTPATPQKR